MDILREIVINKKRELEALKLAISMDKLEEGIHFGRKCLSMKQALLMTDASGIIAEFKRKSPSQGIINDASPIASVVRGYQKAGASAISILTDQKYFGGSGDDLIRAREEVSVPILRKEFIIDEFQILESKSLGADVILLIAAILSPAMIRQFTTKAHDLGLEVLLEVHDKKELLDNLDIGVDMIGINNRDLKTFNVSVDTSRILAALVPPDWVMVSESGIEYTATVIDLRSHGYKGFLMGQRFMESIAPGEAAQLFIDDLYRQWKHS